jgi:uncharacterized membrane protein
LCQNKKQNKIGQQIIKIKLELFQGIFMSYKNLGFMNYKNLGLVLVVLILSINLVSALSVSGAFSAQIGQCETVSQKYSVCVDAAGTYTASVEGAGSNWISVAPSILNIAQSSCADLFVFITPECYANSGTYTPQLIISGPEEYTKEINLTINQTHTLGLLISPSVSTSYPCKENNYTITVSNTSKFNDEYVFSQSGLPAGWATYSQDKIILAPNTSTNVNLKVNPFCSAHAGDYNFSVSVSNTKTNASASMGLKQTVLDFTSLSVTGLGSGSYEAKTCEEYDQIIPVQVRNLSDLNDVVDVSLLDANNNPIDASIASLDTTTMQIDANKAVDLNILLKKNVAQRVPMVLRVHSKDYDRSIDTIFTVVYENCFQVGVSRESVDTNACFGKIQQNFVVSNNGTREIDANVSLTSDGNLLEVKQLTIQPQSSTIVSFTINPETTGQKNFVASASNTFTQADLNYDYLFEDCYSSIIETNPVNVCSGAYLDTNETITNTGTRTQTFSVLIDAPWANISPKQITLAAGESKELKITGIVPSILSQSYTLKAVSSQNTIEQVINFTQLTQAECNDFNYGIVTPQPIDVNCCSGKIVEIVLANTGYFDQNYSITNLFPEWVTFNENNFVLKPSTSKSVFAYFAPPISAIGPVSGTIVITNDANVSKNLDLSIIVFDGNCGVIDTNAALQNDSNKTNPVSLTGYFTAVSVPLIGILLILLLIVLALLALVRSKSNQKIGAQKDASSEPKPVLVQKPKATKKSKPKKK